MRSPRRPFGRVATVRVIAALAGLALGAGCAVGPDYHAPAAPKDPAYTSEPGPLTTTEVPGVAGGEAQHVVVGDELTWQWWTLYQSPALNRLVLAAYAHNPSVEAAKAALRQAQELVYAQQGFFFPTVGANYNFERQKLAGNLGGNSPGLQGNGTTIATTSNPNGPPYNGPVTYNFHTAQLTVGYAPDVFGANRRAVESLKAQTAAARYQVEATYLTLASNVVAAAIQEASLRAQLKAAEDIVAANERSLAILQAQFGAGYVMRADLAAQQAALAQARGLLPPLQKQLAQTRDLLRSLAGQLPDEALASTFTLEELSLPQELPVSLPSSLVLHRPDVAAAAEQLHAATAEVGVAEAARLPQFAITADLGGAASVFSEMFRTGGPFWDVGASVAQTLFDGGTLRHRERAAEQAVIEAAAQYKSTVIGACQNVADALYAIQYDADAFKAATDAEQAAAVSLKVAQDQLKLGQVSALFALNAQTVYQQAVLSRVQAQAQRLGDTAGLFMAVGGGWWTRPQAVDAL